MKSEKIENFFEKFNQFSNIEFYDKSFLTTCF